MQKWVFGNWKMNGLRAHSKETLAAIEVPAPDKVKVAICPPATILALLSKENKNPHLAFGGQDCHALAVGAFTGDVSAEMLKDAGANYVIVGHSERRQHHAETSMTVHKKAVAARRAGLMPIICIGESLEERETRRTEEVLAAQIKESVPEQFSAAEYLVAYEPIWAIGTGKVASPEIIAHTHRFITSRLPASVKVLYGGSVNADNAAEIMKIAHVDGVLVGGASLKAESFNAIIRAAVN
jgi:triosephosphate isomerase